MESKRRIFPRFYFVSNAAILIILSQGSDPLQMQPYYEKVFDSVNQVEHDKSDKGKILAIKNISGSDEERVKLAKVCLASGSIEVWLGKLVVHCGLNTDALGERDGRPLICRTAARWTRCKG